MKDPIRCVINYVPSNSPPRATEALPIYVGEGEGFTQNLTVINSGCHYVALMELSTSTHRRRNVGEKAYSAHLLNIT